MLDVVRIREKAGFKFAEVRGTPADHASWWSFDDEQELRDRFWHPRAGDTVLDVGAAFGSYTLPALAAGARVVAFSPADFDTELLEKNLSLNPELARRCLVVRDGVYSRDGWFDPDHCRYIETDAYHNTTHGEQWLRVRSLDSFLVERPGIARVDWIKMDIEGAELEALRGAEATLRAYWPRLLIECHNFHDPNMERNIVDHVLNLNLGYRAIGPIPHCAVSHVYCEAK